MDDRTPNKEYKLIWDFRGPDSERTAQHHEHHLKEFIKINRLSLDLTGTEFQGEQHCIAFLVVSEQEMPLVRDALKPHRGQIYEKR